MHAASRDSLQEVQSRFDAVVGDLDTSALTTLGDELAAVQRLLQKQVVLRKHLASRTDDQEPKVRAADQLLTGKIADQSLDIVKTAVGQRWSVTRDLPEALQRFARLAVLVNAEKAGEIENTEDELFRFGRTLESNARLAALLSDEGAPADGRVELLNSVLGDKVNDYTKALLEQTVRASRGHGLETDVDELVDLAAAYRGQSIAQVTAAHELSEAQLDRLSQVLSQIYDRRMSVQLVIDPAVIGGLSITVGDEIVDGTVASRLGAAAHQLQS